MKKITVVFVFILIRLISKAQLLNTTDTALKFTNRFSQCENKWVIFPAAANGKYNYGFIYMDAMAGFTYDLAGFFRLENGSIIKDTANQGNNKTYSAKYRLSAHTKLVSLVPQGFSQILGTLHKPDWLKIYATYTDTLQHNVSWGTKYNAVNECATALKYLEPAYKTNPHYKGLEFELAYAYNVLQQYDSATTVLEAAIKNNPSDYLFYKELSYATMHNGLAGRAEAAATKGIELCADKNLKAEMAYNVAYEFFTQKNKAKFTAWATEAKKWTTGDSGFSKNIAKMEAVLNK
jgi:tetratricopeptide (TPR) repeat protein